jgi:hypothetical protein
VLSFFIKWRYPLTDKQVIELAEGLDKQRHGESANDPISRIRYRPMDIVSDEEQETCWLLNHFSMGTLAYRFDGILQDNSTDEASEDAKFKRCRDGCKALHKRVCCQMVVMIFILVGAIVGTCGTFHLLWSENLQFVPTLFVVFIGIGTAFTSFCFLRLQAVRKLESMCSTGGTSLTQTVEKLIAHQRLLQRLGYKPKSSGCVVPDPTAELRGESGKDSSAEGPPDDLRNLAKIGAAAPEPDASEDACAKTELPSCEELDAQSDKLAHKGDRSKTEVKPSPPLSCPSSPDAQAVREPPPGDGHFHAAPDGRAAAEALGVPRTPDVELDVPPPPPMSSAVVEECPHVRRNASAPGGDVALDQTDVAALLPGEASANPDERKPT